MRDGSSGVLSISYRLSSLTQQPSYKLIILANCFSQVNKKHAPSSANFTFTKNYESLEGESPQGF